ncbi:hypothetical protein [Nonomuraea sp. GTA35]|uniref:hypothetical protein n=1 Tax=Nonomuraea sp. GTA35 TaxID=1676746 RepID=UPI0035BEDC2A
MLADLVAIAVLLAIPLGIASAAVTAAALSAPHDRHGRVGRVYLVGGLFVSFAGAWLVALSAWLGREDSGLGAFPFLGMLLLGLVGAGLLVSGLGPSSSWLLGIFDRHAARLPLPARLAARDLAGRRRSTAPAVAVTMIATAFGIALTIIAVGVTGQSRAGYLPQARPGALLVGHFSAADAGTVRAAIERELPGVPVAQSERLSDASRFFQIRAEDYDQPQEVVHWPHVIGDGAMLRYLTGHQSTPYDENTVVVVTNADVQADAVEIVHAVDKRDGDRPTVRIVPARVARTADPTMETVFVPSKIVRDLGFRLEPDELIVDPTLRRVSVDEQERLDGRLGDEVADTYVERGFQPATGWVPVVAAAFLVAAGGALATGRGRTVSPRPARVLRHVTGRRSAFRWFAASRTGLAALCGTVLGAVAGIPIGMSLIWVWTTTWEEPDRVPFETRWALIAAMAAALPLLAAALGGLLSREDANPRISPAGRARR